MGELDSNTYTYKTRIDSMEKNHLGKSHRVITLRDQSKNQVDELEGVTEPKTITPNFDLEITDYSQEQIQNAIHYYFQCYESLHRIKQIFNVYNKTFERAWRKFKKDNGLTFNKGLIVFKETQYRGSI